MSADLTVPLQDRLRTASAGYPEWRVQHPVDKCYCISFDRRDSLNPEREAREWLAEFRQRHPQHEHASYEVACVQVQDSFDRLMIEAAAALASLSARLEAAERDAARWRFWMPWIERRVGNLDKYDAAASQEGKG